MLSLCEVTDVLFKTGLGRSSTITVRCDPAVFGVKVNSISENPICHYNIDTSSNAACGSAPSSCTYFAAGQEYDLSSVPVLSSGPMADGSSFSVSLCKPALMCANDNSYACQTTAQGQSYSLGTTSQLLSGDTYNATFQFSSGSSCVSGPRSALVDVVCGRNTAIVSVYEPTICSYDIVISTPDACPSKSRGPFVSLISGHKVKAALR